jgi:hypothetical protein
MTRAATKDSPSALRQEVTAEMRVRPGDVGCEENPQEVAVRTVFASIISVAP